MARSRVSSTLAATTATVLLLVVASVRPAATEPDTPLGSPKGEILLTITGDIAYTNSPAGARIDRAMLEKLGTETLQTSTPWTDGSPVFKGVLVSRVLDLVKAAGKSVKAVALNDYAYELPISDLRNYPVLLAFEMDGRRLEPRDKGPLWLVYPLDQFSELRTRATERKMVWQLKELQIK